MVNDMTVRDDYLSRIGALIRDARQHSGLTQAELATELKTSQSAVNRIEKGQQNLTLDMLARIGSALDSVLVTVGTSGPSHLRVAGGTLSEGAPADITVLAPDMPVRIDAARLRSRSKNTPFDGWELRGGVAATIVAGRTVYQNDAAPVLGL